MTDRLDDVWTTRDYPVLIEVVRRFDIEHQPVGPGDVAHSLGMEEDDVLRATRNLNRAGYVNADHDGWVMNHSAEALRIAGAWPDAGDAVDRLLWALEERISGATPEEKSKLAKVRDAIVGMGRDVAVEVIGAAVTGRIPM